MLETGLQAALELIIVFLRCSKCTEMDESCDPLNENYRLLLDTDTFEYTCSPNNSPCEHKTCQCDLELINSIVSKMNMYDPDFSSSAADFNPLASCIAASGLSTWQSKILPVVSCKV